MKEDLLAAAWAARKAAYAPYSGYSVGAALWTLDGSIITGCNVENSSFSLTCCAERVAAFQAIARGSTDWVALAIVARGKTLPYPCGACRQVLSEFSPHLTLLITNGEETEETTLKELFPHSFHLPPTRPSNKIPIPTELRDRLLKAGRSGQQVEIHELLDKYPHLAKVVDPHSGMSPLHQAARHGDISLVDRLLKAGVAANIRNRWGLTPLHYASRYGNLTVVERLLQHGTAAVDDEGRARQSPLDWAVIFGHMAVARRLLDEGVEAGIFGAAGLGLIPRLQQLIGQDPELVRRRNEWGGTPLTVAVAAGQEEAVRVLLAQGAAVDVQDDRGWSPLDHAATDAIGSLLRSHGARCTRPIGLQDRRKSRTSEVP